MYFTRAQIPKNVHSRYGVHRFVHDLVRDPVNPNGERTFLFRDERNGTVTIISETAPKNVEGKYILTSREFTLEFKKGAVYHFSIVANPSFMERATRKRMFISEEKHQLAWLLKHLKPAGRIEKAWINSTRKCAVGKPGFSSSREVIIGEVEYEGAFVCDNPKNLECLVKSGIGHAKGFGLGMLLLKQIA